MNDTLMRQWAMLRAIPRHPRRIDAPTLHKLLTEQGMAVSLRTVQRDLNALAQAFPLDFDASKPQGWNWRQGVGQLEIPSMDAHAALTFNLVEQYIQNLLPRTTLSNMAPWFEVARGVANSQASYLTRWKDKLRVVPHTLNKVAAPIDSAIQETIYNALLLEQQLEVTYRALSTGKEAKTYPIHPLGLVVMDQVVYLVCTVKTYRDARFLAMHRIDAARMLDAGCVRDADFDIDRFILREFGIRIGNRPVSLVLRVRGFLAQYLKETPVAPDQQLQEVDDVWTEISATVPDTVQLRTWIRSLGPDAVVQEPSTLREELRKEHLELVGLYETAG